MRNTIRKLVKRIHPLGQDQRGITGLETAIVLIAFVVVSSVFAFAALSTGLFTNLRTVFVMVGFLLRFLPVLNIGGRPVLNYPS